MIYRILFILCLIIFSSCKRTVEKPVDEKNYIITGIVTDKVTGQTVAGAVVNLARLPYCEDIYRLLSNIGLPVTSGSDGKFKIVILKTTYDSPYPGCKVVYASKAGYNGSNKLHPPSEGGELNEKIELYHFAQLNLHVKNDTINNKIDEVEIWLDYIMNGFTYPEYREICIGKDFNKVFSFNKLIGNMEYFILEVPVGSSPPPGLRILFNQNVTLKPDSITDLFVSF